MTILLATARSPYILATKLYTLLGKELSLQQWQMGGFNFCRCQIAGEHNPLPARMRKRFQEQIAQSVAAFIIEAVEEELLAKIFWQQYEVDEQQEAKELCLRAKKILDQADQGHFPGLSSRRELLARRLKEYLQDNSYLNIDGFIQFRLPDYMLELEQAAEEAVEEYIVEKEYDEFISVLRYFVEMQEPRVEKVHVVLNPQGGFQLYGGETKNLEKDYLEGCMVDMEDNELNCEDLLLSALITLAPRQIILHGSEKGRTRGTVNTLKNVFGERVTMCSGCKRCRQLLHKF
ncbi:MAG: putative sporulation protein YtxC [Moorellaceae bacterium]